MINYDNLFFRSGNITIDNYDFLKRFSTLHDFLILNEGIDIIKATKEQSKMIKKNKLVRSFLLEEESNKNEKSRGAIKKAKTKTQSREIISLQKSVMQ